MTLEATVQKFGVRLRAFIRRRVAEHAVDDIYSDILLKLAARKNRLDTIENLQAWLFQIANNAVIDYYRKNAVEAKTLQHIKTEHFPEPTTQEKDGLAAEELSHCIAPFIEQLPKQYREAIVMTDIKGLTQLEAAQHTGISLPGMKSRVQRARKKLKEALTNCCTVELNRRGDIMDYHTKNGGCSVQCK